MDKNKLIEICLTDKNIYDLIDVIRNNVKLTDSSVKKCAIIVADVMVKNINKLSRNPRNIDELNKIVKVLNSACIQNVIQLIVKKYPSAFINKKINTSNVQIERDIAVHGTRQPHIQDRPSSRIKNNQEDYYETPYNNANNYAPYNNNLLDYNCLENNNFQSFGNSNENLTSRLDSESNNRNIRQSGQIISDRPPTPDFSLDGSGEKRRLEKIKQMQNMNNQNSTINDTIEGINTEDPYYNLLVDGAPRNQMGGLSINNFNNDSRMIPEMQSRNSNMTEHAPNQSMLTSRYEQMISDRGYKIDSSNNSFIKNNLQPMNNYNTHMHSYQNNITNDNNYPQNYSNNINNNRPNNINNNYPLNYQNNINNYSQNIPDNTINSNNYSHNYNNNSQSKNDYIAMHGRNDFNLPNFNDLQINL